MDLSRAKTILIIAFLMLNLFLSYRLWYAPQNLQAGQAISGEEIANAQQLLAEHGFEVLAAIPREVPRLSLLHVSRYPQGPAFWVKALLGEERPGVMTETGSLLFERLDQSVEITRNGQVLYRQQNAQANQGQESSQQTAENYLRERELWQDDLTLDRQAGLGEDGTRVSYVQTHQGFPIFSSTVDVYIDEGKVYAASFSRVEPVEFSNQEVQVISAVEALETFVDLAEEFTNQQIVDIALGYFSADYDAQSWEIVPVWRISAADGNVLYINAFTGEAEIATL